MVTPTTESSLSPIEVTVSDDMGIAIPGAHVRATYVYSGLNSDSTSAEDGTASVPLLYCDKEPMRVEAVAPGHQAESVSEYQPDREHYKLPLILPSLKSEWEQVVIPIRSGDRTGSIKHPTVGTIHISGGNFHISNRGDVSVNGSVAPWHAMALHKEYQLLWRDGTEVTIRFLEMNPGFSLTLECSPPKQHSCVP